MHTAGGTLTQSVQRFAMTVCWMFLFFLVCRISNAAEAQDTCPSNDKLQPFCICAGQSVSVPCPKLSGEEFKFSLLKDEVEIYNHTCSHVNRTPQCEPLHTRAGVQLISEGNSSLSFMLTGLNASSQGVYRCKGTVRFPPPLCRTKGAVVLVLIKEHLCNIKKHLDTEPGDHSRGFPWVWVLVLVPVTVYGIIVSIFALFFWLKLKRTDSQSDYMNTKPRAPRGHRKKRGVQNPTPRYF
ncbi:T-cell-specific surface glycoprotein CD28-like [Cheilinus undulatus]|uniref:T-cell-specific surface glycoprotein CD28-like n=1 Tax=Cheilinus undulatus TaxID=241271 RepID=UPI001BD54676|nr:T-cell-specific surface glycoprotein CD28-like [Cheilinus undulatus]